ncbi:MAG: DUF1203 domain-containing protein [Kangiellaceae bacterium]|nr:DUF1203 domain-containing protein [Kangiellaceae bacterium]MCW8997174.1 DUF1203 domain-containing protein [Kangiellaceae bacterium]MCW9015410.1 DUF1203 domain-containing protein [Kangiellaceae bacterium]
MNHDFQVVGLSYREFARFFEMSGEELQSYNAFITEADAKPGYPCRVSLVDAEESERILAINYEHHNVASPYRASGPIFVRENAESHQLKSNQIPNFLKHRYLSLRAYNRKGNMVTASTAQGQELESIISDMFDDISIEYLHIHNASPGCYVCKTIRPAKLSEINYMTKDKVFD